MVRFAFSFLAWMVFGNWVYDEIKVTFPGAVPVVDAAMKKIAIPTHDRWNQQSIAKAVNGVGSALGQLGVGEMPIFKEIEAKLNAPSVAQRMRASAATRGFERF